MVTRETDQTAPIDTGRTWRDLPPAPPEGEAPAPVHPGVPAASAVSPRRRVGVISAVITVAVLLVAVAMFAAWSGRSGPTDGAGTEPVAVVAQAILPSVVQIETPDGLGSGFVYDPSGRIFTAAHVVAGSDSVTVRLGDGRSAAGTVVARNREKDVAVVAVDLPDLVAAPLAEGEPVEVGQTVVAVGSPFGLDQTVTSGIVSALDRSLAVGGATITGLIQTDAAINRGNSGGPLVGLDGRVIGINVAIASASGGSNGIGFAVPIDTALAVAGTGRIDGPQAASPSQDPGSIDPRELFDGLFDGLADGTIDPRDLLGSLPPELRQMLDELGGFDQLVPATPSEPLVTVGALPDGYGVASTRVTTVGSTVQQVTILEGEAGSVAVRATAGPNAAAVFESAAGKPTTVAGRDAVVESDELRIRLVFVAETGTAVEIIAPAALGEAAVLTIAENLEVR